MADTDSISAPDDQSMFDSAVSDPAPAEKPEKVETEQVETGQPRDEHGRFASKAEQDAAEKAKPEPAAEAVDRQPAEQKGSIPPARLREEAEARRKAEDALASRERLFQDELAALRRDMALLRQPAQKTEPIKIPDLIEDPEGYRNYLREEARIERRRERIDETFEDAKEAHGQAFDDAFNAIQQAPKPVRDQVINAANPGKALMRWHREQKALAEIGTDFDGYQKRIKDQALEEALKDPTFRQRVLEAVKGEAQQPAGQTRPNTVTRLPPSLNRATGARSNEADDVTPMNDAELFRHVAR